MGRAGVEAVFGVDLKGQRGLGMRQRSTRVKETEGETVLGASGGHGSLQKEDLIWGFRGSPGLARRSFLRDEYSKGMITCQ